MLFLLLLLLHFSIGLGRDFCIPSNVMVRSRSQFWFGLDLGSNKELLLRTQLALFFVFFDCTVLPCTALHCSIHNIHKSSLTQAREATSEHKQIWSDHLQYSIFAMLLSFSLSLFITCNVANMLNYCAIYLLISLASGSLSFLASRPLVSRFRFVSFLFDFCVSDFWSNKKLIIIVDNNAHWLLFSVFFSLFCLSVLLLLLHETLQTNRWLIAINFLTGMRRMCALKCLFLSSSIFR